MHLNQCVRAQQQRGIHRRVVNSDSCGFFNLLTGSGSTCLSAIRDATLLPASEGSPF